MSATGRRFGFHLQRALLAPLVAALTWAAFPRAEQSAPERMASTLVRGIRSLPVVFPPA